MDYSSAFIVYMSVFESPSILLFNEKVVSHWLLFYAQKSFHLPSLIAVEFTKSSYYCTYILSTHALYLSSRACKCMWVFQHGGVLCWWKDAKWYRHQLSTLVLLWPWNPALSPYSHRNLVSSFQMKTFPIPSCVDYELILITFTPGQQDKQCSGRVCHSADPSRAHSSAVGSRGLIHTVLSGGGGKTFPHHKLGQEYQGHFAAVRLTDQPQLTAPHAHLERAGPCTGCSTYESPGHIATPSAKSPFFPRAFKAPYPPVPVQAHRTPWVSHQSSHYVEGKLWVLSDFLQQWVSCQTSPFFSGTSSGVFRWLTDLSSPASSLWKSRDSNVLWHLKKCCENSAMPVSQALDIKSCIMVGLPVCYSSLLPILP